MKLTQEAYTAAIPKCCSMQTYREHEHIMLCWGLCAAIEADKKMDCTDCDLRNPDVSAETVEASHG